MVDVAAAGETGLQQTYRLLNETLQFDTERGDIRLGMIQFNIM
jgi:hypothetical protein